MDTPATPSPQVFNSHVFTIGATNEPNPRKCLMKDGRQVLCHKQAPMLLQKAVQVAGQPAVEVIPVPCSTDCGKANIMLYKHDDGTEKFTWRQTCDPLGLEVNIMSADEAADYYKEQEDQQKKSK